jgi:hypothetical protein
MKGRGAAGARARGWDARALPPRGPPAGGRGGPPADQRAAQRREGARVARRSPAGSRGRPAGWGRSGRPRGGVRGVVQQQGVAPPRAAERHPAAAPVRQPLGARLVAKAVGCVLRRHARALAAGELVEAPIGGVVHVILDLGGGGGVGRGGVVGQRAGGRAREAGSRVACRQRRWQARAVRRPARARGRGGGRTGSFPGKRRPRHVLRLSLQA